MIVVFIGPPGSGKGTQAKLLEDQCGFKHISTGDLLRGEVKANTSLGNSIKDTIAGGGYVSDEVIMELVSKAVAKENGKIIFDGCPRTLHQAKKLDNILKKYGKEVDLALDFVVDFDKLVERISGRFSCEQCGALYHAVSNKPEVDGVCDKCGGVEFKQRPDDKAEVLKERLELFHKESGPVVEFYKQQGLLTPIEADSEVSAVSALLRDKLRVGEIAWPV